MQCVILGEMDFVINLHICDLQSQLPWLPVPWGENPCNVEADKQCNTLPAHHSCISEIPGWSSRSWAWTAELQWAGTKYFRHIFLCGSSLPEYCIHKKKIKKNKKRNVFNMIRKMGKTWRIMMKGNYRTTSTIDSNGCNYVCVSLRHKYTNVFILYSLLW